MTYFYPKQKKKIEIPIVNNFFKYIIKIQNVDKVERGGGGQPMWIILKFYNIIIKSANMDKGGGGKTLIHKMWIKRRFFFLLNPALSTFSLNICNTLYCYNLENVPAT